MIIRSLIGYLLILACLSMAIAHEWGHWPINHWLATFVILSTVISAYFRGRTDEVLYS